MISEYTTVQSQFSDPECIKASLKDLGYVFEEHEIAQKLYGFQGDARSQEANSIVRRKHVGASANDVGFRKTETGKYELIISEFDRGGKTGKNFLHKMKQLHAKHAAVKKVKKLGFRVKSVTMQGDRIKIKARG